MSKKFLITILFVLSLFFVAREVFSADCSTSCPNDQLDACIAECKHRADLVTAALKPHEQNAQNLEAEIADIESTIKSLSSLLDKKKVFIESQESKLSKQQQLLNALVRDSYKNDWSSQVDYFLTAVIFQDNVADIVQGLAYRQDLINQQKKLITSLVLQLVDLQNQKKQLEDQQGWLADKQGGLETTLAPIKKLISDSLAYQAQLTQTAGVLSARQQELLAEKTGNFSTSVGDVPPADDPASRPDFNPGFSPAYAGFSFGAPHRKGMSQYGAYGRAKSGKNVEDILRAYYGGGVEIKKDYSTGININVQGFGSYNIEDYVKRIYEVPNSWGDDGGYEALKAQAVAARSYALAYTNNGSGSICATESCQVFQSGAKGGNWDRAVNDTKGWVLMANGQPLSAWYAASAGGYTYSYAANGYSTPGEWDTKCGSQGCWTGDAYEKVAGSPWFYKAWYRPRYRGATRSHPWLTKDEFADIVNAVQLYEKDNGTLSHLSQTDKSNPDTWSRDQVRSELSNRGGSPVDSVDSTNVTYSTGGYTSRVTINGRDFDGGDFRQIFNIRAPGEIWLASALFDIRQK